MQDTTKTDSDTTLATLANGVRVLTIHLPHLDSVHASVFVRTGSQHESAALNGISHVVEHMAFKGTHTRSCQQINLDAERLGAEVNAHTDKDHSAFHMYGHGRDTAAMLQMLGDIVRNSSFPDDELERERKVILQEYLEDEDDPMSTTFKLFDKTCYGSHPFSQPVIGTRRNIERFGREDLQAYVKRQYTGANVVIGVAGRIDAQQVLRHAEAAFGTMPAGSANRVAAPSHVGGVAMRRLAGCPQSHLVLGFPIPALDGEHHSSQLAAALFGEGMSSPLMDQLRERRGLVYYAACSADVMEHSGQFVVEASTAPENVDEFFAQVMKLMLEHADHIDPVALDRARNQIVVRALRLQEQPSRRLEAAAMDLFFLGRIRTREELAARMHELSAEQVRCAFARLLASRPAVALAGKLRAGARERVIEVLPKR